MTILEQQIAALISAHEKLKTYYQGARGGIDRKLNESQQQHQAWLNTRHVGFNLTDTLIDQRDSPITLQPRFSNVAEADTFSFNSSDDYAPAGSYTDLHTSMPAHPNWFSEPKSTQFTGRVSVYADISIGYQPHPNPKAVSRIALLHNQIGAHHGLITTGSSTPNYTHPRLFMGKERNQNLQIKGQSYGISNYDDLLMLAENESHNMSIGLSFVRIINLGPTPIHVKGFWIIYHGHQKEE